MNVTKIDRIEATTSGIDLGKVMSVQVLLMALEELVGLGATLYIEDVHSEKLVALLTTRSIEPAIEVERGTLWPRPNTFHVAISQENVTQIRNIAAELADPDICAHLIAYKDHRILLQAYDAGGGNVVLGSSLSAELRARIQEVITSQGSPA